MPSRKSKLLKVYDQLSTHKSSKHKTVIQNVIAYNLCSCSYINPFNEDKSISSVLRKPGYDQLEHYFQSMLYEATDRAQHITVSPNLYLRKLIHSGKSFVRFKLEYHPPSCCCCALLDNATHLITTYVHSSSPFIKTRK